jgi:uncharacterized protein (DUF1501 family)
MNGDRGTDHGVATCALLAGGAINGGRVFADWPGLARANLVEERDLKPTIDMRSIFKGVLRDHLSVPTSMLDTTVFPESASVPALNELIKGSLPSVSVPRGAIQPTRTPPPQPAIARYRRARNA